MRKSEWKRYIIVDRNICHGKPHIKGTRISVELILNLLASGMGVNDILREYPQLREEEVRSCLAYSGTCQESCV